MNNAEKKIQLRNTIAEMYIDPFTNAFTLCGIAIVRNSARIEIRRPREVELSRALQIQPRIQNP